jgi:IS5 family transposase
MKVRKGMSDERIDDSVCDRQAIRRFISIDRNAGTTFDATILLKISRLLETHSLTKIIFDTINGCLAAKGLLLKEGTIVDVMIIAVRHSSTRNSSTKNKAGERNPDMYRRKKGNEWYFNIKTHITVVAASGLAHTVVPTASNVNDVTQSHARCCRGSDTCLWRCKLYRRHKAGRVSG